MRAGAGGYRQGAAVGGGTGGGVVGYKWVMGTRQAVVETIVARSVSTDN